MTTGLWWPWKLISLYMLTEAFYAWCEQERTVGCCIMHIKIYINTYIYIYMYIYIYIYTRSLFPQTLPHRNRWNYHSKVCQKDSRNNFLVLDLYWVYSLKLLLWFSSSPLTSSVPTSLLNKILEKLSRNIGFFTAVSTAIFAACSFILFDTSLSTYFSLSLHFATSIFYDDNQTLTETNSKQFGALSCWSFKIQHTTPHHTTPHHTTPQRKTKSSLLPILDCKWNWDWADLWVLLCWKFIVS